MAATAVSSFTDYQVGGAGSGASAGQDKGTEYWSLEKCKKAYQDYLGSKREEIDEQKDARRYRHGAQWTSEQIAILKKRRQPVVTFNRIGRKIAGVVGLIERLRQDPKAFPRTPKHEQGADLATAVLRYVLDQQDWKAKSPIVGEDAAVDGIGGIELTLIQGDSQDPNDKDLEFDVVEPDSFFYDPRSIRHDFSDARFMGVGKWLDLDTAKEMFPDNEEELDGAVNRGGEFTTDSDREMRWSSAEGDVKKVRIVDIWYKHKGEWCWCLFAGSTKLLEGLSYFKDEKRKTICKFLMFSANVDHDGDRYGFVRDLKSAQDEMNHRRSKALHILNSRRLIGTKTAVDDIEKTRAEWNRPDGVVLLNSGTVGEGMKAEDQAQDFLGQLKMLENSTSELENFGPNPALIGQGIENKSGRAIALLQQAGIAELGPYILAYRGWKVRVYRAIWNAVQQHWTGERWIRVTDDNDIAQFVQINGVGIDPNTGMPAVVNAVGSLDVDIILDEGPDHANAQADLYETLQQVLPAVAPMLTPPQAQAAVGLLVDSSSLTHEAKKKFRDASKQKPDPAQEKAKEIQLADAVSKIKETDSKTMLNMARAQDLGTPDMPAPMQPQEFELPPDVQVGQALADIEETRAAAMHKRAQADKLTQDALLQPFQMAQEAQDRHLDRQAAKQSAPV